MEFLVTITQDWAALRGHPEYGDLVAAERRVGRALIDEGTIARIWRLPGRRANVGIWHAADATALVAALDRLPLRAWVEAEVVPLATHELEATWRCGQSRCQTSTASTSPPSSAVCWASTSVNHSAQRALTSVAPTLPKAVAASGAHSA